MELFKGTFTTLNCPRCLYGMDVELTSILLEQIVFCPCCKSVIQLTDTEASIYGAQKSIDLTLKSFRREIKKLDKTLMSKI